MVNGVILMSKSFSGKSADECYEQLFPYVVSDANDIIYCHSRNGATKERLHVSFSIENPRQRWVTCRAPLISPAFAFAELITIMSGNNDSEVLNFWNPSLPKYQGTTVYYPGSYGERLRSHFNIDQLDKAYESLKLNPDSRQVVLLIWDPKVDLPKNGGKPNSDDIPCNICSLLKVRKGKLYWTQVMRSNDLIRGVPYNILQFTSLQEILAGWLNLKLGEYTHYSDSLHYHYQSNKEFKIQEAISAKNSDIISESKEDSENIFKRLFHRMNLLRTSNIYEQVLDILKNECTLPPAYWNMLMILCLYAIRRKGTDIIGLETLKNQCKGKCTNGLYLEIWNNWLLDHSKG